MAVLAVTEVSDASENVPSSVGITEVSCWVRSALEASNNAPLHVFDNKYSIIESRNALSPCKAVKPVHLHRGKWN